MVKPTTRLDEPLVGRAGRPGLLSPPEPGGSPHGRRKRSLRRSIPSSTPRGRNPCVRCPGVPPYGRRLAPKRATESATGTGPLTAETFASPRRRGRVRHRSSSGRSPSRVGTQLGRVPCQVTGRGLSVAGRAVAWLGPLQPRMFGAHIESPAVLGPAVGDQAVLGAPGQGLGRMVIVTGGSNPERCQAPGCLAPHLEI